MLTCPHWDCNLRTDLGYCSQTACVNDKYRISNGVRTYYNESISSKIGNWEIVYGVCTPGGDPLYRCPFCMSKESEHVNGIENHHHRDFCPSCGAKLSY